MMTGFKEINGGIDLRFFVSVQHNLPKTSHR